MCSSALKHSYRFVRWDLSLVFLVSGASYEASYETSFALVLYDSPVSKSKSHKTDANKASHEASYEAPMISKTRLYC